MIVLLRGRETGREQTAMSSDILSVIDQIKRRKDDEVKCIIDQGESASMFRSNSIIKDLCLTELSENINWLLLLRVGLVARDSSIITGNLFIWRTLLRRK